MYDDPDRVRLPAYRGRLLVAALLSFAAVGPIVILLGPILVGFMRDTLHVGCTEQPGSALSGTAAGTSWICPEGMAYFAPGLTLAAALAGACFCVAAVRIVRSVARRAPYGQARGAAARDLARLGIGCVAVAAVLGAGVGPSVLFAPLGITGVILMLTALAVFYFGDDPSNHAPPMRTDPRSGDA